MNDETPTTDTQREALGQIKMPRPLFKVDVVARQKRHAKNVRRRDYFREYKRANRERVNAARRGKPSKIAYDRAYRAANLELIRAGDRARKRIARAA